MRIRNIIITAACLLSFLASLALPVSAQPVSIFLLQLPRKYYTNVMWSREHARMGGVDINSNIMGTGGENDATMSYELQGKFDMFESLVGYLDSAPDKRRATFEVWGDGVLLQKLGPLASGSEPSTMRVMCKGVNVLVLRIVPGSYNHTASAAWGEPRLWVGVESNNIPGSVIVTTGDDSFQAMPNITNGRKEVKIPVPLAPGTHEYRLITEYDELSGQVKVTTHEVTTPRLVE